MIKNSDNYIVTLINKALLNKEKLFSKLNNSPKPSDNIYFDERNLTLTTKYIKEIDMVFLTKINLNIYFSNMQIVNNGRIINQRKTDLLFINTSKQMGY